MLSWSSGLVRVCERNSRGGVGVSAGVGLEKEATLQRALVSHYSRRGSLNPPTTAPYGGLAVALVESGLRCRRESACEDRIAQQPGRLSHSEFVLFGEDATRVVLSCDPIHLPRIQQIAEEYEVIADVLGETGSDKVEIVAACV